MATAALLQQDYATPTYPIYRLTVAQYHAMINAGILTEDDPVELLGGWLTHKMPKNRPHTITTHLTRRAFEAAIPTGFYVDDEEPITLGTSEPEPDVIIVRGALLDYQTAQPTGADVAVVVEVANATLDRDRTLKKRLYAEAGIPVYWIINLMEAQVEVYTDPTGTTEDATYAVEAIFRKADSVPLMLDGQAVVHVNVQDVLGQ